MNLTAENSEFDSNIFGVRVGLLKLSEPVEMEAIQRANRRLDVVFVKGDGWHYPRGDVVALDHRYEMATPAGLKSLFKGGLAEIRLEKPPRLTEIAETAFCSSRFYRDPLLKARAPALYIRWLAGAKLCWTLKPSERDGAFLVQQGEDLNVAEGRIDLIAVHKDLRKMGVGRWLLQSVIDTSPAQTWRVCVSTSNVGAVRFYESAGFCVLSTSTAYHVWIH